MPRSPHPTPSFDWRVIWEVRDGISAEEFQEFIDGPNGVNFGLNAWMNICREIDVEMAGQTPYPRKF